MVSGVEVSGEVDVTISKVENLKINNPIVKTDKEIAFIVSKETLDEAINFRVVYKDNFYEKINLKHYP